MRFAGAISILALAAGSTAFGQNAADREQCIADLQKQLDAIAAQLRELQGQPAAGTSSLEARLDGAVRQSPSEALREPRRLNISAPGLEGLDITGGVRGRGEYWGNYETGAGNADGFAFGGEAWLGFNMKISEKTSVFLQPQASYVWGDNTVHNLGDPNDPTGGSGPPGTSGSFTNTDDIEIVQAVLMVSDFYGTGGNLGVGRQKVELGAERMIGDDEWNLNRTTFDGFRYDNNLGDPGNVTFIALRVEDVTHSSAFLVPTTAGQEARGDLFGVYYTTTKNDQTGQFDVYVLHLEDPNYGSGVSGDETRWTTYGGRWQSPSWSGLSFDVEAATQFGEYLGQKTGNHDWGGDVWAAHAGACWKAPEDVQFFDGVCVAYDYATGGDDTSDRHSFVQLYPSVHSWFGLTDFFSWTNIEHWMAGVNFDVGEGTLMLAYHWNRMASGDGSFYGYNQFGGTGSTNGNDLGEETDLVYSVQCSKSTAVDLGLGYFRPGGAFESIVGGGDNVTFGYLQFRTAF
jgi:hypothetical protein